jgi:hypothetical protein
MSNNKQSSIDWLEEEFVKLESTIGVQGVFYELLEQAKAMHREEQERLSLNWATLREHTRDTAMHIGFTIGFESGILCYEDYYEELDKSEMDEDEFRSKYISEIKKTFNKIYNE